MDMADNILHHLQIGVLDLVSLEEFRQWHEGRRR
jgi:hypothetical protein